MQAELSQKLEEKLTLLQELIIDDLLAKVGTGEISSAEIAQAVQLFKHNGINIDVTDGEISDDIKSKLNQTVEDATILPFYKEA